MQLKAPGSELFLFLLKAIKITERRLRGGGEACCVRFEFEIGSEYLLTILSFSSIWVELCSMF